MNTVPFFQVISSWILFSLPQSICIESLLYCQHKMSLNVRSIKNNAAQRSTDSSTKNYQAIYEFIHFKIKQGWKTAYLSFSCI